MLLGLLSGTSCPRCSGIVARLGGSLLYYYELESSDRELQYVEGLHQNLGDLRKRRALELVHSDSISILRESCLPKRRCSSPDSTADFPVLRCEMRLENLNSGLFETRGSPLGGVIVNTVQIFRYSMEQTSFGIQIASEIN